MRIGLPALPAPLADGFGGYQHATDKEALFDVPIAEAEAGVQPYTMAHDLGGKLMVFVALRGGLEESCLLTFSVYLHDGSPCLHHEGD
jgi:hypothetical protein